MVRKVLILANLLFSQYKFQNVRGIFSLCNRTNVVTQVPGFRAEKPNKHVRVLTLRQATSLKKWLDFRRSSKKKFTIFVCFLNIPGKQQHFNLANGKLVYYFHGESIFIRTKLTSRWFPNPLFSRGTQEIWMRREILSTNALFILHFISNPLHI